MRLLEGLEHVLDVADGLRFKEHVAAGFTDFGGHVIDDNKPPLMANGVDDLSTFISPRTTLDGASHGSTLLCIGVTHLGGFGSYTVMIITTGWAVVHTM